MPDSEPKSTFSAFITFINKFGEDYSIWLWLVVFNGGLLVAYRFGWATGIPSAATGPEMVGAGMWFCFCMAMNAKRMQTHILHAVVETYRHVRDKVEYRRQIRNAKKVFRQIMLCDCAERDWLVWYIYVERKLDKYKNYRMTTDRSHSWTDVVAASIVKDHKLFDARNKDEKGNKLFFVSYDEYFLFEMFNFKNELDSLLDEGPGLRQELEKVREEVGDSGESFRSKKKFMEEVNLVASDDLTL